MDLTLDDDQLLLAESARQLFERTYTTESAREAEDTPDGFSADLWKQAVELGWPGIALPEDCGGAGYGALELSVLAEELGRGAATLPLLSSYAATLPLLWAGSEALQARWLAPLAAGEAIAALTVTGPRGGERLDVSAAADGWRLSGTKVAVPFGAVADVFVVSVDLDAPSLVMIAADAPGIARARHDTFAPTPYASVTFDQVVVTPDDVVGDAAVLERALAHQTVVDTAYAVGLAGGALALAVDHATNREQFGRPIGVNQAVSHQCVDMRVEIDAMRVLTLQAAWRLDRYDADPDGAARAVALANAYARDVLPGIFTRAHQVHGAIGFTMEYDLQLYTRRAKAYELTGGGAARHLEQVAHSLGL
ncbi:MAG TPA: acyl-CoA dehydrogenase family protein [Acidimicrobiia bacterium]|jgi:alkylation response protein AidB-like acyl-CoA dehydrogenase